MCACASHAHEKQKEEGGRGEWGQRRSEKEGQREREGCRSCESEVKSRTTTLITPRAEIIKTILTMMLVLEKYEMYIKLVNRGRGRWGIRRLGLVPNVWRPAPAPPAFRLANYDYTKVKTLRIKQKRELKTAGKGLSTPLPPPPLSTP